MKPCLLFYSVLCYLARLLHWFSHVSCLTFFLWMSHSLLESHFRKKYDTVSPFLGCCALLLGTNFRLSIEMYVPLHVKVATVVLAAATRESVHSTKPRMVLLSGMEVVQYTQNHESCYPTVYSKSHIEFNSYIYKNISTYVVVVESQHSLFVILLAFQT